NGGARRPQPCARQRPAGARAQARRRRRHRPADRRLHGMTGAFLNPTWPTFAAAHSLGGMYDLMAVRVGLLCCVLPVRSLAYGQLIMAGAYAVAYASVWGWPTWAGILLCFGVVLALSTLMDWLVFRPLRTQSPSVMLVATFAVAFLLQSIAILAFGQLGTVASSIGPLNQPWDIGGVLIRKIAIVSI